MYVCMYGSVADNIDPRWSFKTKTCAYLAYHPPSRSTTFRERAVVRRLLPLQRRGAAGRLRAPHRQSQSGAEGCVALLCMLSCACVRDLWMGFVRCTFALSLSWSCSLVCPPPHTCLLAPLESTHTCTHAGTDVSIVTFSRMVGYALEAAKVLEQGGISAEVINLRCVFHFFLLCLSFSSAGLGLGRKTSAAYDPLLNSTDPISALT